MYVQAILKQLDAWPTDRGGEKEWSMINPSTEVNSFLASHQNSSGTSTAGLKWQEKTKKNMELLLNKTFPPPHSPSAPPRPPSLKRAPARVYLSTTVHLNDELRRTSSVVYMCIHEGLNFSNVLPHEFAPARSEGMYCTASLAARF